MLISLSLLGALLVGVSTIAAVDITGYLYSGDCGLNGKPTAFPWRQVDGECFTWQDNGPHMMFSVKVENLNENGCQSPAKTIIKTWQDTNCTEPLTIVEVPYEKGCVEAQTYHNGTVQGFSSFMLVCCTGSDCVPPY